MKTALVVSSSAIINLLKLSRFHGVAGVGVQTLSSTTVMVSVVSILVTGALTKFS